MLLTITTTHRPATDLGYLLHKSPLRSHSVELPFGIAHVVFPEVTEARCTAALVLDIDPVSLVRHRRGPSGEGGAVTQYVNDRPYVASSFTSVAIARVFGTALSGRSKERQELAETAIPLQFRLTAVPSPLGPELIEKLFAPLGYVLSIQEQPLDEQNPAWGPGRYFTVALEGTKRLSEALSHLYVLIPVLDNEKHYWVGPEEVEKLLRHGEGWLSTHPHRDQIARRYLKNQRDLTASALARLREEGDPRDEERTRAHALEEAALEAPLSLNEQRLQAVAAALQAAGAHRVLDLGCGEGHLLKILLHDSTFTEVVGMDVSVRSLEVAKERLELDRMPELQRARLKLLHGSLMYRDSRLAGYDAAAVVEVIEHLDPPRRAAFERVVFEFAKPKTVVVTTPNAEYNVKFEHLPRGTFRHRDHRFEWSRAEFDEWATGIAVRFGYTVRLAPIGAVDERVGAPTQMATFSR